MVPLLCIWPKGGDRNGPQATCVHRAEKPCQCTAATSKNATKHSEISNTYLEKTFPWPLHFHGSRHAPREKSKGLDISIHEIHSQINASPSRIEIKQETAKDAVLSLVRETIMTGWPETRKDCLTSLHGYWNYRDKLAVEDGLILNMLKGTRIAVPKAMHPAVLEQLHYACYAHQGIEKCKLRAKGSYGME